MGTGSKRYYKECAPSRVAKYQGIRRPACNGGHGCNRCVDKYNSKAAFTERSRRARWRL